MDEHITLAGGALDGYEKWAHDWTFMWMKDFARGLTDKLTWEEWASSKEGRLALATHFPTRYRLVTDGRAHDRSDIAWLVVRHLIQEACDYWRNNGQAPDDCRNAYIRKTQLMSGQKILQAEIVGIKVTLKIHQWKMKTLRREEDLAWNGVEDILQKQLDIMWGMIKPDMLNFDNYFDDYRKLFNTKLVAIQIKHPNINTERFIRNYMKNEDQIMHNAPLDFSDRLNVEEQMPTHSDLAGNAEAKPSSKISETSDESISLRHSVMESNDEAQLSGQFQAKAKIDLVQHSDKEEQLPNDCFAVHQEPQQSQAASSSDGMLQILEMKVQKDDDSDDALQHKDDREAPRLTWKTDFSTWLGYGESPPRTASQQSNASRTQPKKEDENMAVDTDLTEVAPT